MSEEEKNRYRFSGYEPPLIQLDGTGPAYWCKFYTHPYYQNQPEYWKKPAFRNGGIRIFGNSQSEIANTPQSQHVQQNGSQLYSLMPICKN